MVVCFQSTGLKDAMSDLKGCTLFIPVSSSLPGAPDLMVNVLCNCTDRTPGHISNTSIQ